MLFSMRTLLKGMLGAAAACVLAASLPSPALAEDAPTAPIDKMFDKYWGKKREVKVIEKRVYPQGGRHELTLFAGSIPNAPHYMLYPMGGRYDFYFIDWLGMELSGAYIATSNSDLEDFLTVNHLNSGLGTAEHPTWYGSAAAVFSPLHGKLGAFTSKLAHFDFLVALGGAGIGVTGTVDEQDKSETKFGGVGGAGFRFFLTQHVAMRLDYRHFFHPGLGDAWVFPAEFTLGVNFFAGGY